MKKLVIFDMDGVLLDSEPLYREVNEKFFGELGAVITPEEYESFIGISATKMWDYIKNKCGLPHSIEDLKAAERELKHRMLLGAELMATKDVVPFLDHLRSSGYLLAIASSSLRKNIDLILSKLNISHYFQLIVSGEQVERGKPEPDIFLKAAHYFNLAPEACLVIEDSANGVKGAKAAGMFCVGYYNPNSGKQDLSKADFIVDSFTDERLHALVGKVAV